MNELTKIVENSGLETVEGNSIIERFGNYESIAKEWETKAKMIVVTDETQTTEMAMAREARKKFSELRINVEKARKEMKEQSLRKGQAIDSIARFIVSLIDPIEKYLRSQENFIEIQSHNKAEEERIALEKKIEEDRIAKEKADREEQERIRLENEKLKKEAEERERVMLKEREKAEKEKKALEEKARIEREERERVQAELQAKKNEEERIEKEALDKIESEKQEELKRSDTDKYTKYIQSLIDLPRPNIAYGDLQKRIDTIISFVESNKI